jgi:hypothetical protein
VGRQEGPFDWPSLASLRFIYTILREMSLTATEAEKSLSSRKLLFSVRQIGMGIQRETLGRPGTARLLRIGRRIPYNIWLT